MICTDYFVISPYEVMPREEFLKRKEELAKRNRKVIAIVTNCKDIKDFENKYFNEIP